MIIHSSLIKKSKVVRIFVFILISIIFFDANIMYTMAKEENEEVKIMAYAKVKQSLNVRERASTESRSLYQLKPGELVEVISCENDQFIKVETQDESIIGYVASKYLVIPDVELEQYELVSSAVITANSSSENRNYNMQRAAMFINGTILKPGDEFAWYSTENSKGVVGVANKQNGFKQATVIQNGKYVKGYGGGVCQVSTALYNCIIKIGIEPTEHHHHSLKSSYVKEGMDATVSYPNKNFVFNNTKDYSIMIEAYTDGGQVVVNTYKVLE